MIHNIADRWRHENENPNNIVLRLKNIFKILLVIKMVYWMAMLTQAVGINALKNSTANVEADMARSTKLHLNMAGCTWHTMIVTGTRTVGDLEIDFRPPAP